MNSDIQKKLADAVNNNPLPIEIKGSKETRNYELKQPSFKILIETSRLISEIGITEIDKVFKGKDIFKFIAEHGEKVVLIIAMALENSSNIKKDTIDFLQNNLNSFEIYDLLSNVILRIGVQDFQKSIIGTIPMSLLNQRDLIALIPKTSIPSSS